MDIRERLEILANGRGQRIAEEIKSEVETVNSMMKQFSITLELLKPPVRFQWLQAQGFVGESAKLSDQLDRFLDKVKSLETKRGVRDYILLESQRGDASDPREYGQINRRMKTLKDMHARDLSDMVSNRHQAMLTRIKIVNRWKTILAYEVPILENCRNLILANAEQAAERSGDAELLEKVRDKLKSIQAHAAEIRSNAANISSLQNASIHVLRKTVIHQLDEVVKLERVISEKKQSLKELSEIVTGLKQELPPDLQVEPDEDEQALRNAQAEIAMKGADSSSDAPASSPHQRMAFQDERDKRR